MRWLADECADADLVRLLRERGHDVAYVAEFAPRTDDTEVIRLANRENRLLLTEDKDFGELVFRRAELVPGLVLVRIDPSRRSIKGPRLLAAINHFGDALFGCYTVVEDGRFRSRPLRPA